MNEQHLVGRLTHLQVVPTPAPIVHREEVDARGRLIPNLRNTMTVLRTSAVVADAFGYDLMMQAAILLKPLPQRGEDEADEVDDLPRPVRDTDVSQLQEWLQNNGLSKVSRNTAHDAVDLRATENAYHPVCTYLSRLQWDGDGRVDAWLSTYLGVERHIRQIVREPRATEDAARSGLASTLSALKHHHVVGLRTRTEHTRDHGHKKHSPDPTGISCVRRRLRMPHSRLSCPDRSSAIGLLTVAKRLSSLGNASSSDRQTKLCTSEMRQVAAVFGR